MQITQEQLRRFAQLGGWTSIKDYQEGYYETYRGVSGVSPEGTFMSLPDFLNDLGACFEVLDHFCNQHDYDNTVSSKACVITRLDEDVMREVEISRRVGTKRTIAIVMAVLSAGKGQ